MSVVGAFVVWFHYICNLPPSRADAETIKSVDHYVRHGHHFKNESLSVAKLEFWPLIVFVNIPA